MKYKQISFFNKYNLEPSLEIGKLMVIFQTEPAKRKDLPLVIQIIRNNKALFDEELYTEHNLESAVLKAHKNLLESARKCQNNISVANIKKFDNCLKKFLAHIDYKTDFFYASTLDNEYVNEKIKEFADSLVSELYIQSLNELESIDGDTLSALLALLSKYDEKYTEKLEDSISSKFEAILSTIDNEDLFKSNLKYLQSLPISFFKRENIYRSYLFLIDKALTKNDNLYFVNKYFIPLIKFLLPNDADKCALVLIDIAHYWLDIENKRKLKYSDIKTNSKLLVSNYSFFFQNIQSKSSKLDTAEIEQCIAILAHIVENTESWWQTYCSLLEKVRTNSTADNIYLYVEHIIKGGIPKNVYKVFASVLLSVSNLNADIAEWSRKNENAEKAILILKGSMRVVSYSELNKIDQFSDLINTPSIVDDLLCKFYVLIYLDSESFTNTVIENIQASAFSMLQFMDCGNSFMMTMNSGVGNLTYKGLFLRDVLIHCPSDWSFGGTTVERYLCSKLECYSGSSYGESKFRSFKSKYDNLFSNTNKYIKQKNELLDMLSFERNKGEAYKKAVGLLDKKEYYSAYTSFYYLNGYKDAEEKAKEALTLHEEHQYAIAVELMRNADYNAAKIEFEKILFHKDAKAKLKECNNQITIATYNSAVDLMNSKQYKKAAEEFNKVSSYSDAKEKAAECNRIYQELENEKNYDQVLKFIKEYETGLNLDKLKKAVEMVDELLSKYNYKDTKELSEKYHKMLETRIAIDKKKKKRTSIFAASITILIIVGIIIAIVLSTSAVSYTVTFNMNGGGAPTPTTQTITPSVGLTYPINPTRSGYIFAGWYENAAGTGTPFNFASTVTSDKTLYAKWQQPTGHQSILTIGNAFTGSYSGTTIRYYAFVPLVTQTITIRGTVSGDYYLGFYNSNKALIGSRVNIYSGAQNLSCTVTAGELYYIGVQAYYSSGSGSPSISWQVATTTPSASGKAQGFITRTVTFDTNFTLDIPTHTECIFKGWYDGIGGTGTKYADDLGASVRVWDKPLDTTLYAKWESL